MLTSSACEQHASRTGPTGSLTSCGRWRHRLFKLSQGRLEYSEKSEALELIDFKYIPLEGLQVDFIPDEGDGDYLLLGPKDISQDNDCRIFEIKCNSAVETAVLCVSQDLLWVQVTNFVVQIL